MKFLNFSILFAAAFIEVIGKERGLTSKLRAKNKNIQEIFYIRRPKKKKKDLMPKRFCTHQNCRNCLQGLTSKIFHGGSGAVRVCKLLLVSPRCCYDNMFYNGYSFQSQIWKNSFRNKKSLFLQIILLLYAFHTSLKMNFQQFIHDFEIVFHKLATKIGRVGFLTSKVPIFQHCFAIW